MRMFEVLLDNGHGVNTKGKRSPDESILEYEYNRRLVKAISERLEILDIPYYIVTPEEEDIPLPIRKRRINERTIKNNFDGIDTILISVHLNAYGDGTEWTKPTGWSVYTSKGDTKSDEFATKLYNAAKSTFLNQTIREDFIDGDPDFEEDFYILKRTVCPAVLTENFFMTNTADVDFLLSKKGFDQIVDVHIKAIQQYNK